MAVVEEAVELAQCVVLDLLDDVGVGARGDGDRAVSEDLLHRGGRDALGEEQRGAGMPWRGGGSEPLFELAPTVLP